ncbi:hypothetical protein VNO78_08760 [Psophocarpus tetragonolobus]|uniref:Uncharacterized protein n=1 Tax=Psophocarpus tetragonolobus TaxID=3891 RepID=A0AAN9SXP1_PSOTE
MYSAMLRKLLMVLVEFFKAETLYVSVLSISCTSALRWIKLRYPIIWRLLAIRDGNHTPPQPLIPFRLEFDEENSVYRGLFFQQRGDKGEFLGSHCQRFCKNG